MEEIISLITMFSLIGIFMLSKLDFKLFAIFGDYSYEVYLLHWPLLYRFNLFYSLPPFLIVVLQLVSVIILGFLLQKLVEFILKQRPSI